MITILSPYVAEIKPDSIPAGFFVFMCSISMVLAAGIRLPKEKKVED